jgi:glycosyltransferase involved in cell wall biosynthesis
MSGLRLLQAIAGAPHGGAEIFFVRLALAFQRGGQEQRVLIRRDAARTALLNAGGIQPIQLPFGNFLDLKTRLGYRRAIREYRPRVVLTWMSRATALCPRGEFVHVARLGGYYDLKYYVHADHLIGNTRDIVKYLVRAGWPRERAHYLPNFVPAENAVPTPRASLATPEDVPLALALGRLHPNKGFDVLLDALARAPHLHLWIAGDGELRHALESHARERGVAGRVRFLGWRDDTAALLAAADMLVCPSRHEPLGNVVIEAWAQARPVIAAASQGPAALIAEGETGILVPVEDAEALAHAMSRLAQDAGLRARLAAAGHAVYAAQYSEAAAVAEYRSFFARIAA